MSDHRDFSDEELTAYLDGEADAAPRAEMERALAQDPQLRARLDALSLDKARLGEALAPLLKSAPDPPELDEGPFAVARDHRTGFAWQRTAAAAVLALVVGFGAGSLLTGGSEAGWRDYVASYQALYANSTLSHIDQPQQAAAAELERVSSAIGKPIALADVTLPDQLDYKRAQILSFEGRPLIQLAFLSKVGAPVALCIVQSAGDGDSAVQLAEMEGMSTAYWSKDGYAFILIGGQDDALIARVAAVYSDRI